MLKDLETLKQNIAGELIFATDLSSTLKKWRNIFEISQKRLAYAMQIKPTTLSDYENGRRPNPSINFIKKFVSKLIELDLKHKGHIVKSLLHNEEELPFITREFKHILKAKDLSVFALESINHKRLRENLYGITIIDTYDIRNLDIKKYPLLFGKTNKRIFYFTQTKNIVIIEFLLKLLKYITNQQPLAIFIEKIDAEDLKVNVPLYKTALNKEEMLAKIEEFNRK
jgi:putative transcriptional regulator